MTTDDTRPDLPTILSAVALRSYMRATGWHEGPHGTAGSLWSKDAAGFAVPHDDGEFTLRGVIARLAAAEGRTLEETAAAIAAYRDARAATKPCGCGPLEPCGPHLGRGSVASVSTSAVTSPAPGSGERLATATGPAEGNDGGTSSSPVAVSRAALGRLVHDTRLAAEAERAEAEGRQRFRLGEWEERTLWQRELDMRIGAAVAAAERERAEEVARPRATVDLNVRVRKHETYSRFEDVTGTDPATLRHGDRVLAVEVEDGICSDAIVTGVDRERHLVYLVPDWHAWRDTPAITGTGEEPS